MPVDRSVSITATGPMLTLGELRALVSSAVGLPDETVVRGASVPFKVADLGNVHGLSIRRLSLTDE